MRKATPQQDNVPLPEITVVVTSPPPAPAASRRKMSPRQSQVLDKAASLPPGGWFVWPEPPTSWRVFAKKHLEPLRAAAYATYDGRVIVKSAAVGTTTLAQATPAQEKSPMATSVVSVAATAAGAGGAALPSATPPPNDRHQRLILKAMSRLGVAVTKSNLASAMGLQTCPADAMEALVSAGLVEWKENKSGRAEFFLTQAGRSAAFEIHRQERP